MARVKTILIVGGGAAGWLSAGILAAKLGKGPNSPKITLVESSDIPIIGVGEGTWPSMRATLKRIGLSETDFMRFCNAGFKQGSEFVGWLDGSAEDRYYHPFSLPRGMPSIDPIAHWQASNSPLDFAHFVDAQADVCDAGLGPKSIAMAEFQGLMNYGYHLDAGRFADILKQHCRDTLGVQHIVDTVGEVTLKDNDAIDSIKTQNNGTVQADLFIDCTGTASLLLGGALGVDFIDRSDVLFCDRALAVQVPYNDMNCPVATHTISTAHSAGWTWDIGLTNRRGIGYVFSSNHLSESEAAKTLMGYVGRDLDRLNPRLLKINIGHRAEFWRKNCIAIGMSAGFLEPLEASALMMVETAAIMLADGFPYNKDSIAFAAKRFNASLDYRWDRIIDFLKLHYVLSRRKEPFWQDHRVNASIPASLQERMDYWQYSSPTDLDFTHIGELFPAASYQFILCGMGAVPKLDVNQITGPDKRMYQSVMAGKLKAADRAMRELQNHRQLLDKVNEFGFQTI